MYFIFFLKEGMNNKDSFQLIRNATFVLKYGGKKFLIDPLLAKKDEYPDLKVQ